MAVANVSQRHSQPGVEAHCLLPVDSAVRRGIRFCVSVVVRLARIVCVGSVCVARRSVFGLLKRKRRNQKSAA